jgi:hypothetical protein
MRAIPCLAVVISIGACQPSTAYGQDPYACQANCNLAGNHDGLNSFTYSFSSSVPSWLQGQFNSAQNDWAGQFSSVGVSASAGQVSSGGVEVDVVPDGLTGGNDGVYYPPGSSNCPTGCIWFSESFANTENHAAGYAMAMHESGHAFGFYDFGQECAGVSIMSHWVTASGLTASDVCWLFDVYVWMYNPEGKYQYRPAPLETTSRAISGARLRASPDVAWEGFEPPSPRLGAALAIAAGDVRGVPWSGAPSAFEGSGFQQNKPLVERRLNAGDASGPPPATWAALAAKSDAVVRVRFTAYDTVHVAFTPPRPIPSGEKTPRTMTYTRYSGDLIEVLKDSVAVPVRTPLAILRRGGIIDTPTQRIKEVVRGFPDWILGNEFVLFLKWSGSPINGFVVLHEADGTLHLRQDGTVDSPGVAPLVRSARGKPVEGVLREIRTALGGGRSPQK